MELRGQLVLAQHIQYYLILVSLSLFFVSLLQMVSERYHSGDRKLAGDGISPVNIQEVDIEVFLRGFGRYVKKGCPKKYHPLIQIKNYE